MMFVVWLPISYLPFFPRINAYIGGAFRYKEMLMEMLGVGHLRSAAINTACVCNGGHVHARTLRVSCYISIFLTIYLADYVATGFS